MPLNHNIFNARTYTVGAFVIVIILAVIVFRECTPKVDDTGLQNAIHQYDMIKKEADSIRSVVNRIAGDRDSLAKENAGLKDNLNLYQRQNIKYAGDLNSLSRRLNEARSKKDTQAYVTNCDSLQMIAENQQGVIQNQDITTQALIDNYDEQLAKADSVNSALLGINNKLQTGYTFAIEETKKQNEAAKDLRKKYSREKTKTRILAGAAIAAIVYSIIPK